jgi:lipid-A-disaccharide synthase
MRIFLSAGEPSGDLHAANLVRALRKRWPDAEFVGFGGPRMAEAGTTLLFPLVDMAVMWFLRVLINIRTFIGLIDQADRYFRDERPDAVVLIDYPGLHWWIARKAKERGITVVYYVPPQIWAWAGWRVKKVRKYVDHVLCSLPFEPAWYHARGVPQAVFVGHPYFDELADRPLDAAFIETQRQRGGPVVALLPGSRTQEVSRNFPVMLKAATQLSARRSDVRFVVACLHEKHRALVERMISGARLHLPIEVFAARTAELIRMADLAWAVSGSVGIELMVEALPSVVLYKLNRFDLWIARPFIKARYISIVNLMAGVELMPEYLTSRDISGELAQWAWGWLDDPKERAEESRRLAALRDRVALPGASERAADRIVEALGHPITPGVQPPVYRGPHERPASVLNRAARQGPNWG